MTRKKVLVAGASGLVGYAAIRHFLDVEGCEVVAVSRRKPEGIDGAHFIAADLTDAAACAKLFGAMSDITRVIYAALYEAPGLVAGWREAEQITINDSMLRNLLGPLENASPGLRHVSLLQGTKAYGVHARAIPNPSREDRDEARDIPNFYWKQEDYLRDLQKGKDWHWSVFRPVLIVGVSQGSAMNLIPAIGVYAAMMKRDGQPLHYPAGAARVAQAVDADLLARAMAYMGEEGAGDRVRGYNQAFNVTNGDVFNWPAVWPAIAAAFDMPVGEARPLSMVEKIAPREADWADIRRQYNLTSPGLKEFVGLSFQYADYSMGFGRTQPGEPRLVSTIKLMQAGFTEVMDTEAMFAKAIRGFRQLRLLP
jgi:nucleoside-diphosphate-sugar epimerase